MDSNLRRVHYQCLNLCQEKKRLSIRKKKGCGKMRPKIEKMATICMLTFGSFLCMMGLIRQNAEAVSEWNIEIVDTAGDVGKYNSIAIDSYNRPHIAYFDDTHDDLKYAYWDGLSWQIETVDSDGSIGWFPSIAIDSYNRPHISYFDDTHDDLKYAYRDGSSWRIEIVDSDGSVGLYSAIAIDSNDRPHISYFDDTNYDLKYAHWDGSSWQIETVDSDGSIGWFPSMAIDSSDKIHISHGKFNDLRADWNLNYTTNASGEWVVETVDGDGSIGWFPSIAVDSSDNVHMSYSDGDNEDLKYTTKASGEWVVETVDSDGSVGWFPTMAMGPNNHPHISYFDDTNDDLKYAKSGQDTEDDTDSGWSCFIATAAYGSMMEPHVKILRDFRDKFMLANSVGKGFVRLYNTYSPPIADFIAKHDSLRAMVRIILLPVVGMSWIALKIGPASTMGLILLLIACFLGFILNLLISVE